MCWMHKLAWRIIENINERKGKGAGRQKETSTRVYILLVGHSRSTCWCSFSSSSSSCYAESQLSRKYYKGRWRGETPYSCVFLSFSLSANVILSSLLYSPILLANLIVFAYSFLIKITPSLSLFLFSPFQKKNDVVKPEKWIKTSLKYLNHGSTLQYFVWLGVWQAICSEAQFNMLVCSLSFIHCRRFLYLS